MASVKPDISVIITTHNRLWALPRAVESCRASKYRTEIIVVDDGSTDGTWSWLQTQEDLIAIKTSNWGKCWGANTGFAASTGEFVRFLDSDDWLLAGASDRQLELARSAHADVVVAGFEHHDHVRGCVADVPWIGCGDFLIDNIPADKFYAAYLMRRSIIADIPHREEFPHHDCMFLLELALARPKVVAAQFSSVAYRTHAHGNITNRRGIEAELCAWRSIDMYRRVLVMLEQRDECTDLRRHALLGALWREARSLAQWNMAEAVAVVDWIRKQDETFTPPVRGIIKGLYQVMGFEMTERVARARRAVVHLGKARGLR